MATWTEKTDPALWTQRAKFGAAGGPPEIELTPKGRRLAFSVGAQVRSGGPAEALEALAGAGGSDSLVDFNGGVRGTLTELGEKFTMSDWAHLKARGLVCSWGRDGVLMTPAGWAAVDAGHAEQSRLLERCKRAAAAEHQQ